jgi:hypothetical protein
MSELTNPALWVAVAGVITAIGALVHTITTRGQLNSHVDDVAANAPRLPPSALGSNAPRWPPSGRAQS